MLDQLCSQQPKKKRGKQVRNQGQRDQGQEQQSQSQQSKASIACPYCHRLFGKQDLATLPFPRGDDGPPTKERTAA